MEKTYSHDSVTNFATGVQVCDLRGFIRNREDRWDIYFINLPFRSVDTPVENKPRDATANEPPRSTRHNLAKYHNFGTTYKDLLPMLAIVPPWRIFKRF